MKFLNDFLKNAGQKPKKNKYAFVSIEDGIIGKENFPWKVEKTIGPGRDVTFTVLGKFKKTSDVSIISDKGVEFFSELSSEGVTIRFSCLAEKIPNFRIEIE
jgi:hypothetical protein